MGRDRYQLSQSTEWQSSGLAWWGGAMRQYTVRQVFLLKKNGDLEYFNVTFGTRESTLLLASRFLGMWFLAIWMPTNVVIPIFGFIENLLRFLGMWDDNVWFIHRNFKWIIYFSSSFLRFECELPSPLKKIFL